MHKFCGQKNSRICGQRGGEEDPKSCGRHKWKPPFAQMLRSSTFTAIWDEKNPLAFALCTFANLSTLNFFTSPSHADHLGRCPAFVQTSESHGHGPSLFSLLFQIFPRFYIVLPLATSIHILSVARTADLRLWFLMISQMAEPICVKLSGVAGVWWASDLGKKNFC